MNQNEDINKKEIRECGDPQIARRITINNFGNMQYVEYANTLSMDSGADSGDTAIEKPLMAYIADPERRALIVKTLAGIKDLKTLCRSVLWDVYNLDLNDVLDKDEVIVSTSFIQSFTPLLSSFKGSLTVQNIRDAIHRYLLKDLKNE